MARDASKLRLTTLRLAWPALACAAAAVATAEWSSLAAALDLAPGGAADRYGRLLAHGLAWLLAAVFLIRLLDVLFWHGLVERRSGHPVPRLLSDLVAGAIWVVVAIVIIAYVFGQPVGALVATSGVAVAIIGFALRDIIASLFSGIALNLERPYQIGDWIQVEPGIVGKVLEVGWLTTRTVTRDGIGIVIPNARIATVAFRNFSRPEPVWRDSVEVTLDYGLPVERVERILMAAMNAVPQVAAQPKRPDVKIEAFGERGVQWLARYWLSDYALMPEIRYAVQTSILRHLHHAGITVPYPKQDLYIARMPERAFDHRQRLDAILARNELFATLSQEQLRDLAARAQQHFCPSGLPIVRAGDPGASLFVVVEGLLHVIVPTPSGERKVNELGPGGMFGEFSLLTGAPRRATIVPHGDAIVYEITKEDLEPILKRSEPLIEHLSWVLAQRELRRQRLGQAERRPSEVSSPASTSRLWVERVRAFFGVGQANAKPPAAGRKTRKM